MRCANIVEAESNVEARTGVSRDEQMMTVRGGEGYGYGYGYGYMGMGNFRGDENILLSKQQQPKGKRQGGGMTLRTGETWWTERASERASNDNNAN